MTEQRDHEGRAVRKQIRIRATPDEVYAAWADPERIARWFVDRADGTAEPGTLMTWHFDKMDLHMPIPVTKAVPGELLVISGEVPGRLPFAQEIEIRSEGGATTLRLVNSGFRQGAEWDEEYEGVDSGWVLALATLKYQLENYPDQDRRHVLTIQPAELEYDRVMRLFTTADGLGSWLADDVYVGGDDLTEDTEYRLTWKNGSEASGHVLARSPREVLLSWVERDAVLGLKCFSMGSAGRAVGLDYSSWSLTPEINERVEPQLQGALDRLVAQLSGRHSGSVLLA